MSKPSDQDTASPRPSDDAERLFTELFNLSPFPAVVSRISDSTVVAVNARTAALLRRSPEEAIGLKVTDYYVNPADRALIAERIQRDGRADNVRIQVRRRSPGPFWALASSQRVMWHGEPAVLTVFHDINEQVEAEAALKANEQRLAKQSDALTFLTSRYTDPEGDVIDRLRTILAVAAQALSVDRLSLWRFDGQRSTIRCLGLYLRHETRYESGAVLTRDLAPAYFAAIEHERVVAANDAQSDERTREFKDVYLAPLGIGSMLDVPLRQENTAIGVLCAEHVGDARHWTVDEQNFAISVANLVVVALAEDERRHALTRLAESEARARLIIDTAHDAFIGIDSAGRIAAWNAQAERTFGWTREEAIGRVLADTIVPPAFRDAHTKGLSRFHQTGEAPVVNQRLELSACHRDGHEFPIELTISSPMRGENGYFFGAFLRDISERRQRVDELRQAKDTAEAATRAKSEFLANMSHELRTPLNGVIGYAQLLQRDHTLNATQREALDAISKCGSQLLDLINDVLDLSKIEAGRLDIEEAPTDLTKLVVDFLRYVLADAVERKGLRLTLSMDENVPRSVVLDGRHLRQVLLNLLGNAVKFTPAGEVRLAISRTEGWRLRFEVVDTGIGIEHGALTEIFEAFTQTKAGAAAGGTGLGLTISAHLVRTMGDALRVESVPGEGSCFYFELPLVEGTWAGIDPTEAEKATVPFDAKLAPGTRLTALVVDDSAANRRILASLLESAGVRVVTASGGIEGVEFARINAPQVIFMDLKMSDLDGVEATRQLKADPATAKIPVIAVTASAFGETRQTARDAGCVDYLSKPVRAESLFSMLQIHLGVRFVTGGQRPAPGEFHLTDAARLAGIAARLKNAVALGDVSEIQALARDLKSGAVAEAAVGQRISRLVNDFDFEGLNELAAGLGNSGSQ